MLHFWLSTALATAPAVPEASAPSAPSPEPVPAPEPPPPAVGPSLPQPISVPSAPYPEAELAAGIEASVLLEVAVSTTGDVTGVGVVESAGPDFDTGAMAALRGARFKPGTDEAGAPVATVILYRYRYTLARVAKVSVQGHVRLADDSPVAGVPLKLVGTAGEVRFATTGEEGDFRFADLADGVWTLVLEAPPLATVTTPLTVTAGTVTEAELRTQIVTPEGGDVPGEVVVIEGRAISSEVSERTLRAEDIAFLPGTNGDVVKVVQNLPGVARPPLGTGNLIIRGTAPEDSAAFLDGSRIPVVFHFGGLTTVINGGLLDEVSFVPGNASARYGRFLGGMVELGTRDEAPVGQHGTVQVDLYQATLFAESAIAPDAGLTLSLRRSYADAVLVPIFAAIPDFDIQAPRFFDIQARGQARVGATRLEAMLMLSDDTFALIGEEDGAVQVGLSTNFWRGRVSALTDLSGGWTNELRLSTGYDAQEFRFDTTGTARETTIAFALREELALPVADGRKLGWRLGLDIDSGPQEFLYDVPAFGPREEGGAFRFAPGAYAEATVQLGPVRLIPGLRADVLVLDSDYANVAIDPRFSARWSATDTTAVRVGVGRYSQFPTVRQLLPDGDGNPDLHAASALQTSVGLDQELFEVVRVEVTGFYNDLSDLVVGREDRISFFTGPPVAGPQDTGEYANEGTGRVYGGELLVRLDTPSTLALLSLTASRSTRVKRPGDDEVLFPYDQPIVLSALASQKLPKDWRIGARVRYGSGNPYTPVTNRVYDMGSRSFIPLYDDSVSDRLPDFFSLDVRVDKRWVRSWGEFSLYLDVQNATNAQNVEVQSWSYDYGTADPVTGLPIFPTFGLEAKW